MAAPAVITTAMKVVPFAVAVCLLVSCRNNGRDTLAIRNVDVGVENTGAVAIDEAFVKFGQFRTMPVSLGPSHDSVHAFFNRPIPQEAVVCFRVKGEKNLTERCVRLDLGVLSKLEGDLTIVFRICGQTREVTSEFMQFQKQGGKRKLVSVKAAEMDSGNK